MTGDSVLRIALPSGGWWELQTRPRWKHVRQWGDDAPGLVERVLVSLTTGWSFDEEVNAESLACREPGDMAAVLEVFEREVAPYLEAVRPKQMAQELFAGLIEGRIPPEFAEAHIMAATSWSWQTLQETPADVVQRMAIYLAVSEARNGKGSLDFPDTEEQRHDQ